ncbi:MAG: hypothetical protein EOO13_12955 [Chitinophagaceae bacterium]|nr:MAG: hypothetical protein EOO13_12955 [Chitinophagaceae bacterium]
MSTALFITLAAIIILVCLLRIFRPAPSIQDPRQTISANQSVDAINDPALENVWWARLDTMLQLELALALARKALPVWQLYAEVHGLHYRNSPNGPLVKVRPALLQNSINAVDLPANLRFPENTSAITNCYNEFVSPLVALQDGNWALTYPVKKIFLSVYNILKAVVEQDQLPVVKSLLSLSINQSLDCLDMCKLYSVEEIKAFIASYKGSLV